MSAISDVLERAAVHSVFQPIVELATGSVQGYEALARGPLGPLRSPLALFAAARSAGLLAELDDACRTAAFQGAVDLGLTAPVSVFVNVEPESIDGAPLDDLLSRTQDAHGEMRIVLEITERALASRPAELLRTVQLVRAMGWGVALDDVGAEPASLAFMSLLQPDIVKLDLRLVQSAPGRHVTEVMSAVDAYLERSGALLLAEGIETEQHLETALGLGASLGQGWLFGRPCLVPDTSSARTRLRLPTPPPPVAQTPSTPFLLLPDDVPVRRASKRELVEISTELEAEAGGLGETCVVASSFQHEEHFTPATAHRYQELVARVGFVCALGEGLPLEPVPGLRGADLERSDPIVGEWDIVVLHPHFCAALLARDLGDTGPDLERRFDYALTRRRDVVIAAAQEILRRVAPLERESWRTARNARSPSRGSREGLLTRYFFVAGAGFQPATSGL